MANRGLNKNIRNLPYFYIMKKLLLTALAAFAFASAEAQISLQLQNPPATVVGGYSQTSPLQAAFPIVNTGATAIDVLVARKMLTEVTGSENNFCWGFDCYPPNVSVSPNQVTIGAGATNNTFIADYLPNNQPGVTTVRYSFFRMGSTDSVHHTVSFDATSAVSSTKKELAGLAALSAPSPNPARDLTLIQYTLPGNAKSAKIRLLNAIGRVVKEIPVTQKQGQLILTTGNLPNGVYFYTLQADNNAVITKKLIVQH